VDDYREIAPAFAIYRYCPLCASSLQDERDPLNGRLLPTCGTCGWTYHPTNHAIALAVVEADGGLVFVHPQGAPSEAPASLPGDLVEYGETPEGAAVRVVLEQTGLEVELLAELTRFLQEGTPNGPVLMFGFRARAVGGSLRLDGKEGPAVVYAHGSLPAIVPVRVANRRVLAAYLDRA
jgi:NAD+ diphosphatase